MEVTRLWRSMDLSDNSPISESGLSSRFIKFGYDIL